MPSTIRKTLEERLQTPASAGGPRTEAGRARCRGNALVHGLTGAGVVLPDEMREAVERRRDEWQSTLKPFDAYECWLLEQVALQSVRVECCQERENALRHEQALRADESWEADRKAEAGARAAGLARSPESVAPRLGQTLAGCAWLVAQWEALARSLAERGDWDGPQRSLALDLLGVPLAGRGGPTLLDPPAGADPVALRSSVAAGELARLRPLRDGAMIDRDERARLDALAGFGDPECPLLARLRRYERQAVRQLEWLRSQFKNGRYTYQGGGSTTPYRAYAPAPHPRPATPWHEDRTDDPPPYTAPPELPPDPAPVAPSPASDGPALSQPAAVPSERSQALPVTEPFASPACPVEPLPVSPRRGRRSPPS